MITHSYIERVSVANVSVSLTGARLTGSRMPMAATSETFPTPFATPEAQNFNANKAGRGCFLLPYNSPAGSTPVLPQRTLPKQDSIVLARRRLGQKQSSFGRGRVVVTGCSPVQPKAVLNRGFNLMKKLLAF